MKKVAAVVLLIVVLNVVPRVVGVPSIDLPPIDVPNWLRHVNLAKNLIFAALIALAIVGAIWKQRERK